MPAALFTSANDGHMIKECVMNLQFTQADPQVMTPHFVSQNIANRIEMNW